MNSNTPVSLDRAKRNLEQAVTAVKDAARSIWKQFHSAASDSPLDYFYANAANGAGFGKRVQAFRKNQLVQTTAEFDRLVEIAYANYTLVEELAAQEKARKAEKRARLAAKADLKSELNLQEGVSLKGVDVGQYKVILSGLEPVRLHVYESRKESLFAEVQAVRNLLKKTNNVLFNHPAVSGLPGSDERREARHAHDKLLRRVSAWFERSFYSDQTSPWVQRGDNPERIEKSAQQFALAYVQGYAAKLAVKTGEYLAEVGGSEVLSCSVSSANLWSDSVATIQLGCSSVQFRTQIIWNRSCLGKVFNQYPTRRVL